MHLTHADLRIRDEAWNASDRREKDSLPMVEKTGRTLGLSSESSLTKIYIYSRFLTKNHSRMERYIAILILL